MVIELAEFVTFMQTDIVTFMRTDIFWYALPVIIFVFSCLFAFLMYKYPMDGTTNHETKL